MRGNYVLKEIESLRTIAFIWVFSYHWTICLTFWKSKSEVAPFFLNHPWLAQIGEAGHFGPDIFFALCMKIFLFLFYFICYLFIFFFF
jgi:hypothetical protein